MSDRPRPGWANDFLDMEAKAAAYNAENTRLRAVSKDPCVYCQLPAAEMAKCASGFPGCARADDLMRCPELGARMELDAMLAAWKGIQRDRDDQFGGFRPGCECPYCKMQSIVDSITKEK